eukprot:TRINITY_DN23093_c0_g1_i1.p1 TRINITY_DN23093_c0_g1~~TRINITY_DN23093_c0_g1_i1.p1  ORF type:complete len:175 (-),score=38.71 TRINITY_DN23093_c0_g1_i1:80-604(-)
MAEFNTNRRRIPLPLMQAQLSPRARGSPMTDSTLSDSGDYSTDEEKRNRRKEKSKRNRQDFNEALGTVKDTLDLPQGIELTKLNVMENAYQTIVSLKKRKAELEESLRNSSSEQPPTQVLPPVSSLLYPVSPRSTRPRSAIYNINPNTGIGNNPVPPPSSSRRSPERVIRSCGF